MSKGIVVVNIPESCENCLFSASHDTPIQDHVFCTILRRGVIPKKQNKKPAWCPIHSLPERKVLTGDVRNPRKAVEELVRAGYNACLYDIEMGG